MASSTALEEVSVGRAEAWLLLDWAEPLRHGEFHKAAYRPPALHANRFDSAVAFRRS